MVALVALLGSAAREQDRVRSARDTAEAFRDASERIDARAAGTHEPAGAPLLEGFPDAAAWEGCQGVALETPACATTRHALAVMPIPSPSVGPGWLVRLGLQPWLAGPSGRHVAAAAWGVRAGPLAPAAVDAGAWSTALLLDVPPAPPGTEATAARDAALALLGWRERLGQACLACVTGPGALPPGTVTLEPSAALLAERSARSLLPVHDDASATTRLIAELRRGAPVPDEAWNRVGHAGLAALELARAGRTEAVPQLLTLASDGPSGLDRVAGLYALARLQAQGHAPAIPAGHPAAARLAKLSPL